MRRHLQEISQFHYKALDVLWQLLCPVHEGGTATQPGAAGENRQHDAHNKERAPLSFLLSSRNSLCAAREQGYNSTG